MSYQTISQDTMTSTPLISSTSSLLASIRSLDPTATRDSAVGSLRRHAHSTILQTPYEVDKQRYLSAAFTLLDYVFANQNPVNTTTHMESVAPVPPSLQVPDAMMFEPLSGDLPHDPHADLLGFVKFLFSIYAIEPHRHNAEFIAAAETLFRQCFSDAEPEQLAKLAETIGRTDVGTLHTVIMGMIVRLVREQFPGKFWLSTFNPYRHVLFIRAYMHVIKSQKSQAIERCVRSIIANLLRLSMNDPLRISAVLVDHVVYLIPFLRSTSTSYVDKVATRAPDGIVQRLREEVRDDLLDILEWRESTVELQDQYELGLITSASEDEWLPKTPSSASKKNPMQRKKQRERQRSPRPGPGYGGSFVEEDQDEDAGRAGGGAAEGSVRYTPDRSIGRTTTPPTADDLRALLANSITAPDIVVSLDAPTRFKSTSCFRLARVLGQHIRAQSQDVDFTDIDSVLLWLNKQGGRREFLRDMITDVYALVKTFGCTTTVSIGINHARRLQTLWGNAYGQSHEFSCATIEPHTIIMIPPPPGSGQAPLFARIDPFDHVDSIRPSTFCSDLYAKYKNSGDAKTEYAWRFQFYKSHCIVKVHTDSDATILTPLLQRMLEVAADVL